MKNFNIFLISIIFYMVSVFHVLSEETVWKPVDPGGNGWLMFASIHPTTGHIYISSDMSFSLLRSTDQAETWEPIGNPVSGTAYYIAGDPKEQNTLYMHQIGASTKASGIWKSTDNGDTWIQIYQSNESEIKGSARKNLSGVVDPDDNQVIYWTVYNGGVTRSKDGGYTWEDISQGLPDKNLASTNVHCHILEIDPNTSSATRRIYYPTSRGLYRMDEPDGVWELVSGGLPEDDCTDIEVCFGNIIYTAFPDHGLFRSRDGGTTWHLIERGLDGKMVYRVVATDSRPDIVYTATESRQGIYGSQDWGDSFRLLTDRKSNASFDRWLNYRQNESILARIMFVDPNDPYTVYIDYGKKTHDGGLTWQHYGMKEVRRDRWTGTGMTLLTDYRVVFDPKRPGIVWMGFSDTGLMLSEDGGETVINVISFNRGEVNQAAYWRDRLIRTSGSCVSMAVDPDRTTTIYASINGKNADNRASVGGVMIKSIDGGWNWDPIYEKHGLDDGIVRSIVIDPYSPVHSRTIFVASYGNGVYKSEDSGRSFRRVTPPKIFKGNTRVMWLEMAPSDPKTLYLGVGGTDGIRPIYIGPDAYPALKPGIYGGVFKTTNGGKTWEKCNQSREIPSVQDIAVHTTNPDVVYVAVTHEDFLVSEDANHPEWREGGVFRSINGGQNWEMIYNPPDDEIMGRGEVEGVCINPVAPEIVYAAVKHYGVYGSLDSGKTWYAVGKASMDRMQRRYHSIDLNPHDPSEIWVAHFGNSFSKGVDYVAREYMKRKFQRANFVCDPGFEETDESGNPKVWKVEQPPVPRGEKPVFSVTQKETFCARFHLTQAYSDAPTPYIAHREQARLEKEGKIHVDKRRSRRGRPTGLTHTWIYQNIDPYFTTLMRSRRVVVEMDVCISESIIFNENLNSIRISEILRESPRVFLTEVRDYNVHWPVAEASLGDKKVFNENLSDMKGKWIHCKGMGPVSEDAQWLQVTVTGVNDRSVPVDLYVDNVRLSIVD